MGRKVAYHGMPCLWEHENALQRIQDKIKKSCEDRLKRKWKTVVEKPPLYGCHKYVPTPAQLRRACHKYVPTPVIGLSSPQSLSPSTSVSSPSSRSSSLTHKNISPPSSEESITFSPLCQHACSTKLGIFALVKDYSSTYIPKSLRPDLLLALSNLFKTEHLSTKFYDLLQIAEEM